MQNKNDEVRMTYSCVLSRKKEKIVRVTFEREHAYAEGIVPEGRIEKQNGFSESEIIKLEEYLKQNSTEILNKARDITGINHWF